MADRNCVECNVDHPCNKHSTCVIKGRLHPSKCSKCVAIYLQLLENPEAPLAAWWNARIHHLASSQKHRFKNRGIPVNIWGSILERRTFGGIQDMDLPEAEPLIEEFLPEKRIVGLLKDLTNSGGNITKTLSKLTALVMESSPNSFALPSPSTSSLWSDSDTNHGITPGQGSPKPCHNKRKASEKASASPLPSPSRVLPGPGLTR